MKFSSRTSPALLAPKRTSHHPTQIESTERLHALARYVDQDTSCGTIVCLIRNRYHVDHTFTILGCTLLPYAKYITELNLTEPQSHIVGFALWTVNRTIDLRVARLTMGDAYRLPSRVWRPGDIGAFGNEGRKPRVKNVEKVGGSYGAERVVLMSEMP
ncbi:uncharacterized protein STEHIDRAFT_160242 [Stereum hirsutum FP-91666 SS1]|uniref:uncharacterized protein n=1 Tax=Stereum hirsutum (strain FP-91666) TaxID=721885 RepID=UPI0004449370|nr:uncharacterized protein STEHIDRAFT_160242 [Stereum hirsutum FP-91666 SS1]EIM83671.1 hypothetical protein STEHIDRAFT_160242 [Stereum hirsutum FP-91666 SS1]